MAKKSDMPEILLRLAGAVVVSVGLIGVTELLNSTAFAPPSAPTPANENGVVTAEEWGEMYPEIVASYMENDDNNYRVDYLEEDPYLTVLYEGFGFAKDYTSAIGHTYTLEDVYNTERPHALANCLTCKTPDFTKLVNDMGEDAYSLEFAEVYEQMNESVSCYNCHENLAHNDGQLAVTHSYVTMALGEESGIPLETLTCGQCHIEYYFNPENKATRMPYESIEAMDPEAILAYYNEMGFSDWTQESTGTGLLKAQHPELETFLGKGSVHAASMNCADCHMEDKGDYTSHKWISPLESETILTTCASCHGDTDMAAKTKALQDEITAREKEVGEKIAELKTALAEAVASGTYAEEDLNEIRSKYRDAQWYWDFCYVENSEGAHNSSLAKRCLDNAETLAAEGMALLKPVELPETANANGVITAEEWADTYPEIVESYMANNDNNYRVDYLEEDPYLTNIYEGFGFAKDYTSAIGHTYTLEDVYNTERPHALANCLTCKTPDFTKLVNDMGVDAYSLDFTETYEQMNESVSCYNCHENQAGLDGKLVVTHSYVTEALGEDNDISLETMTCGQCHIEYYFDPETKATKMPYDSIEAMDPEAILAFYNEMGFSDWTQESTGTGLLKTQHPELETFLGEGSLHANMLTCADCHMADEGDYVSHKWESPLENEILLDSCAKCHGDTDVTEKVKAIQEEVTSREKEVGEKLSGLKTALADAVTAGELSEDELNAVRSKYRDAQWYWDFCYVENSEGAHNSAMSKRCLDNADALIAEGMALLDAEGNADEAAETEAVSEAAETELPEAAVEVSADKVITAEEWADTYPEIVESYMANNDNNYRVDYLEEDPYLKTIYEGFGFAKDYTSAIGHTYTLEDVYNTERPHALANCLTCKTPDFTKLVNDMGVDAYSLDFTETYEQMNESVSCYNCHENQAGDDGALVVTHSYVAEALGEDHGINAATMVCGQCHIEYYFDPETKATKMPYDSIEAMDPEAILAFYNEMGFSDWTQESTGTGLLKTQHPELETFLGEGSLHANMLTCADCHMADEGDYVSHKWESPLENEVLLDSCAKCHGDTDVTEKVKAIQEEVTSREKEVGEKLAELKTALADAVTAGELSEDELNAVRSKYRDAQWYWDFCYVENSEGAHNSAMSKRCLDNADALITEGMELL